MSATCTANLMVSFLLSGSGSNALVESRAPEGRHVSSKSPSSVRDRDEGVASRNRREKYFFGKSDAMIFFYKMETEKIELVARPEICQVPDGAKLFFGGV